MENENPADPDTPLVFKGVVFNEMKGAFVSQRSRFLVLELGHDGFACVPKNAYQIPQMYRCKINFTVFACLRVFLQSDNERVYGQHLQNKLYPDHTYSVVSGGEPLAIPDLTWEQLRQFHATHYHPSNAR